MRSALSPELLTQFVADVGGMYASHLEVVCVPSRENKKRTVGYGTVGDLREAMLAASTADGGAELAEVLNTLVSETTQHSDADNNGNGSGSSSSSIGSGSSGAATHGATRMPRTVFDEERPGNVAVLIAALLCACCRCPHDLEPRDPRSDKSSADMKPGGALRVCVW